LFDYVVCILINSLIVGLAVLIHYEFLYRVTIFLPRINIKHQFTIVVVVFIALIAHVVEIWLFALGYFLMLKEKNLGARFTEILMARCSIACIFRLPISPPWVLAILSHLVRFDF